MPYTSRSFGSAAVWRETVVTPTRPPCHFCAHFGGWLAGGVWCLRFKLLCANGTGCAFFQQAAAADGGAVPTTLADKPLALPDHVTFTDLQLEREPVTGRLPYLPAPLSELVTLNGDDPARVVADEDLACWYIAEWYVTHRLVGGDANDVAEQIVAALPEDGGDGLIQ